MKQLLVGDPHVQVSNLKDSEKLFEYILGTAKKFNVDRITLLGDLYHNHALKRVEVEDFWRLWLKKLSASFQTVVLMGNHDMANQKDPLSKDALSVHADPSNPNLIIVTKPNSIGHILYMPYMDNREEFVNTVNAIPGINNLTCHQTFDGTRYENGFYDPNGIDANLINIPEINSGHIHMESTYGKVWYPGTAKWDTASDANQPKSIWITEHDANGRTIDKTAYSTWGVVTPIVSYVWKEGEDAPIIASNVLASVECIGSAAFISQAKALLKGKVKLKTKITDKVVRENRKPSKSIYDFLDKSYKTNVDKEKLKNYLKEKQYV